MYKGIGPRNLGSPLKQTTKSYPDIPNAFKKENRAQLNASIEKANTDKFEKNKAEQDKIAQSMGYKDGTDAFMNRPKATGAIKVDNTIESLVIGGPAVKGVMGGATKVAKGSTKKVLGSKAAHHAAEGAHLAEVGYHIGG